MGIRKVNNGCRNCKHYKKVKCREQSNTKLNPLTGKRDAVKRPCEALNEDCQCTKFISKK